MVVLMVELVNIYLDVHGSCHSVTIRQSDQLVISYHLSVSGHLETCEQSFCV